ncbi:LysR family transcriptional regulator, partial [Undibacterium luofuense]|uniref:LysR family transcriptional regulator n=1 Tax=Undibacterium luofuense TaxID=2828733 RepID=UPI0030ED2460
MDARQLKAFVAVFEERNITRAADRLCLTQPTLSVTIRQLEEELGASLFHREARGVVVSDAARRLYPQAQQLLAQMSRLKAQFQAPQNCLPLTLGVEADIASTQIAALLQHCKRQLPQLLLDIQPGCTGDLRLASEELRCEDELFFPLWEESFVLAALADATSDNASAPDE